MVGIIPFFHNHSPAGRIAHGTAEVILVAPGMVAASADSKEVETSYLADGATMANTHDVCKITRAGPAVAMTAGFVRANQFNALEYIRNSYQLGEPLHDFALRLLTAIPVSLGPALEAATRVGDTSLRKALKDGDALQVALVGIQDGQPGVDVLLFSAHPDGAGHLSIQSRERRCPGDCPDGHAAFFLGVHEAIDKAVAADPSLVATPSLKAVTALTSLEYASRPDLVGGPQSMVLADANGVSVANAGACSPADITEPPGALSRQIDASDNPDAMKPFRDELDRRLDAATNLVCHQTIQRYSAAGSQVHQDTVDANLRIIDNREVYTDIRDNGKTYKNLVDIPGAWASGDMVTMLRVTKEAFKSGKVTLLTRVGVDGTRELGVRFNRDESAAVWSVFVSSAPYPMAFEGTAWFAVHNGVLRQIDWRTTGLIGPSRLNIEGVAWQVTFAIVEVSGQTFLAPSQAFYEVKYSPNIRRDDRTLSTFSDFRRFAGTARLLAD